MADQIYDSLYNFQGERANGLIDFGFTMYGYDSMFYHVLVPILVRVGRCMGARQGFGGSGTLHDTADITAVLSVFPSVPDLSASAQSSGVVSGRGSIIRSDCCCSLSLCAKMERKYCISVPTRQRKVSSRLSGSRRSSWSACRLQVQGFLNGVTSSSSGL